MRRFYSAALLFVLLTVAACAPNVQTSTPNPLPTSIKLASGLEIQDLVVGTGIEAKTGMTIKAHYIGVLTSGVEFDNSYKRNEPIEFVLGAPGLIEGWGQGIPGMKVGGKRRLTIPPSLGYGAQGSGPIPPNATLIFDIELVDAKAAPTQ